MRLRSQVESSKFVLRVFAFPLLVICCGHPALAEAPASQSISPIATVSTATPIAWLQILSDFAIICVCIYACVGLARAAWKLRSHIPFRTYGWVFVLLGVTVVARRLLDIGGLTHNLNGNDSRYLVLASLMTVIVALAVGLLVPFLKELADYSMKVGAEQDKFLVLAENLGDGICLLHATHNSLHRIVDFRFNFVNTQAERLLQRRNKDISGKLLSEVLPQIKANGMLNLLKQVPTSDAPYEGELKDSNPNGTGMWVTLRAIKIEGGIALLLHDLASEYEKTKRTEELNRLSQSLIQDAPFSIIAISATGIITAMNSAAEQLTKYRRHELTGKHSIVLLHDNTELSSRSYALTQELGTPIVTGFETLTAMLRKRKSDESEWTYICKDGNRVAVHLALTVLRGADDEITGYLAVAFDISERKKLSDSINYMAHHDALTKLPNRLLLNQRMAEAIQMARALDQQITVVMIDLDHFKRINDSLGHQAGDELLVSISERIISAVRKTDTVARVGGDEFVVLMPNSGTRADSLRCVNRILEKIQAPVVVAGRELSVTASVGVCVYPDWGADPVSLLRNADAAMYAAKDSGRNAYQLFSASMLEASADRLELETDLRHALERNEIFLVYQPQVHCKTRSIVGIEALIRWQHPVRGLVSPGDFIPAAEDCGLILPIGQWVLQQACKEARQMQLRLGFRFTVAINLSPRQFLQSNLAEIVENALRDSGLAAEDLELEITEYTLMISSTETSFALGRLRELGVRIAIDDFGTGFSSFKYILEYEVDRLKIDRSFIAKCPHDMNAASIVRAVIAMAHGLRMKVVAEGVETEEQLAFLTRRRCDEAQGYLFGQPMAMADVMLQLSDMSSDDIRTASQVLELAANGDA